MTMTTQPLVGDYPAEWAVDALLADGASVHVRPIRRDDGTALLGLFSGLSEQSMYFRFFSPKRALSEAEVERFTTVDYRDRMAFVVFLRDEMLGVGRYDRLGAGDAAEVAFAVVDAHQGRGIGTLLLEYLAAYAMEHGITRFAADVLSDNQRMLEVFGAAGYRRGYDAIKHGVVHCEFDIEPTGASMAAIDERAWTAGVRSVHRLLRPRSIAVVGAGRSSTSIGRAVLRNLINGCFTGPVYPVNPNADSIDGVPCHPTLDAVPDAIDLALIAVPAEHCLDVVDACVRKGVHSVVVISSGFAEVDAHGARLQAELVGRAHRGGMRVVGPNCFGVINTAEDIRMNGTFASRMPAAGGIGFASQSGALGVAVLESSLSAGLGLSSFVSMGNKADVSSNDLLRFWSQDGETRAILLYLESFGNPRTFARVAPVVSRKTPIVVVKAGRSVAGTRAAASHTAALASPDAVVDALFRQAGVIRVDTLEELLDCGAILANQPALPGRRLAIVGNAGGAAVLAADACATAGLEVPELGAASQQALRELVGPNVGVSNPVDLGAGATPKLFADALATVLNETHIDGVLVILAPVATADSNDVAREIATVETAGRPLVFVHLGSDEAPPALREGPQQIPCYAFPERAVRALGRIAEHTAWRSRPIGRVPQLTGIDSRGARTIVEAHLREQPEGGWLRPDLTAQMLRAFGIPFAAQHEVHSASAAAHAAERLGFPVALKVIGDTVLHKSDVGGVKLGLQNAAGVRRAYAEMAARLGAAMDGALVQQMTQGVQTIAGVVSDAAFGSVVMFGSGGTAVELFADRVFRILPLTEDDAHDMVRSTRGAPLLTGYRGAPACDVAALEDALLRVARLAEDVPQLTEMDLNPLMATPNGVVAVDARIRLIPWRHQGATEVRRLR